VGLLAWLLRHRAETSRSAGMPLLTCIFYPFSQELGKGTECERVRQDTDRRLYRAA
jgi:hypothetical protein